MKKTYMITGVLITAVLGIIIAALFLVNSFLSESKKKISNEDFEKSVKITDNGYELTEQAKDFKVRDRQQVLKDIHEMANTKIIAEDGQIWGTREINEENLNALIIEVIKSDFHDRQKLLDILDLWKKKDYSKSVEAHNYVWNQLGGTVGKAIDLIDK